MKISHTFFKVLKLWNVWECEQCFSWSLEIRLQWKKKKKRDSTGLADLQKQPWGNIFRKWSLCPKSVCPLMDYFTLQNLSEGQKGAGQQLGCCWTTGQMVGDKPGLRKWIEMYTYGQYHCYLRRLIWPFCTSSWSHLMRWDVIMMKIMLIIHSYKGWRFITSNTSKQKKINTHIKDSFLIVH